MSHLENEVKNSISFIPKRVFKYNPERFNVMSSGAGTQSNGLICMMHAGIIPKSDIIVMSDTEREASNVFEYQKKHIQPLCDDMGVEYVIIPKSQYATFDIYSSNGDVLPGYFSIANGRDNNGYCAGKKPAFCSDKWKREVVQRYLNERFGEKYLTERGVDMWMGISIEEAKRRAKVTIGKWQRRYPLVEMMITKQMCIQFVEDYGLPTPPPSLCWMCPNRDDNLWLYMKESCPDDFLKACEHEKEIQKEQPHLYLTKYGVPLSDAPLQKIVGKNAQMDLMQFCDSGMCFV